MNLGHLRATLWLRWHILRNRIRRGGKLSNVLFGVLLVLILCACVGVFFLTLGLGIEHLPGAEPKDVLLAWIALTLGFLFSWSIGLVTDLQRSDAMSFKNLLHLPVSLSWVFLYNYLSSFVSLSVAIFLPAMLGLSLAMVVTHGPPLLLCFPLLLGFFGMVTCLTYQLRGWLARLMEDKRRGRNIIAAVTFGFVLLVQLPNLINIGVHRSDRDERHREREELRELRRLAHEDGPGKAEAEAKLARRAEERAQDELALERNITLATMLIPAGWLPYGVRATAERRWLRGGLCAVGMFAIGAWSLRRSYRTTMLSVVKGGGPTREVPVAPPPSVGKRTTPMVERTLPFVSEGASSIAYASLRGLLRAPETKLLLLSPVFILAVFGVLLARPSTREALSSFAPALSLGAITMGLLSIVQVLQNQFGLDRAGFRAYVLSPVRRDRILLGKNLATAPLGLGIGLIALVAVQLLIPADAEHFVGACLQLVSAYILLCALGNTMSILSPMRLKEGGFKAANAKFKTILWQLLAVFLVPLTLSPLALPSAAEFVLGLQGWARAVPVYPLLHAAGLVAVCLLYRWMLLRQGELLQNREQQILDVLTRD
ncbi:MAG: ABC transporter permease [bacterium]|nr:ABC transporter permease [bacterium]